MLLRSAFSAAMCLLFSLPLAAQPLPRGPVFIRSKLHGQVLDIRGASRQPGTPVISFPERGSGAENQQWTFEPAGGGLYYIRSVLDGFVLDVSGANRAAGTAVIAWPQNRTPSQNQQWELAPAGDGFFWIRSRLNGMVLDIRGANRAPSTPVIVWPASRTGGDNQLWQVVPARAPVEQPPPPPPPQMLPPPPPPPQQPVGGNESGGEPGRLASFHSGRCLSSAGAAVEDCSTAGPLTEVPLGDPHRVMLRGANGQCLFAGRDARLAWYPCSAGSFEQQWELDRGERSHDPGLRSSLERWFMVRSATSGRCLFSNSDGRFGLYQCDPQYTDQFWKMARRTELQSFDSNSCLRPGGGVAPCGHGDHVELDGAGGAFLIRHDRTNQCLFAHRDSRVGWSSCNRGGRDQDWQSLPADDGPREVRDPHARYRMLRSVSSGLCLYSNRDGRFGVYACTPSYADQYWRASDGPSSGPAFVETQPPPPPPPPPPSRRARDCGTGPDDEGCRESRHGGWAMDKDAFGGLMSTLQATPNDFTKRDMVVQVLGGNWITARQLASVLDQFHNELTRLEVAKAIAGRVIDPMRALSYSPRFVNEFTRRDFVQLMSSQQ